MRFPLTLLPLPRRGRGTGRGAAGGKGKGEGRGEETVEQQVTMALATLTTGIYVLTARVGERAHGMSASWVTQVSGEPPLVMASVGSGGYTHALIEESRAFALNILGRGDRAVEDYFYSEWARVPDNLRPFALETGATGAPILAGVLAYLDCRVRAAHPAGDHTLFVAEVVEGRVRGAGYPLCCHDLPYVYVGGPTKYVPSARSRGEASPPR